MTTDLSLLTQVLLDEGILSCAQCKEVLTPPIWLVEKIGNVCNNCNNESAQNNAKAIENQSLEVILNKLQLPCKYKNKGCDQLVNYKDLANHEMNCLHSTKLCPMLRFESCPWAGSPLNIAQHFQDNHSNHVIESMNYSFNIETSFRDCEIVKLFVSNGDKFFLRLALSLNENKLSYILCNTSNDTAVEYRVKHSGINDNSIKTRSKVLPSTAIYGPVNASECVQVDLNSLKQVLGSTENIVSNFKLFKKSNCELDERLLQYFECPVCKNFMKPPIFQCQSGHSICNLCRPRLEKCPTCRTMFGSTRNFSLEGLTSGIQYPCGYHDLGCMEKLLAAEIIKHESVCHFKPYSCPFPNCSLTGKHNTMVQHLKDFHMENTILNDSYQESFRLDNSLFNYTFDRYCFLIYDQIFRLTRKRINEYWLWAIDIIGSKSDSQLFAYEISIIDARRPEKKLIRTDYCLQQMSDDELFKKCIMFPNGVLSSYSTNEIGRAHV